MSKVPLLAVLGVALAIDFGAARTHVRARGVGAARDGMAGEVTIGIRLAFGPDWLRIVIIHGTDPEGFLWRKAVGRPLSGRKDRCKRFEISGSVTAERETTMSGRRTANEN